APRSAAQCREGREQRSEVREGTRRLAEQEGERRALTRGHQKLLTTSALTGQADWFDLLGFGNRQDVRVRGGNAVTSCGGCEKDSVRKGEWACGPVIVLRAYLSSAARHIDVERHRHQCFVEERIEDIERS